MQQTQTPGQQLALAAEHGRICAVAAAGQRDLRELSVGHRELFPSDPFDPTLFSTLALATAFFSPWSTAEQLRTANRAGLWVFAVDWQIDYLAKSRDDVDGVAARCLRVADGADPEAGDQLTSFLAMLRDDLAAVPAFATLRPLWRGKLEQMLAGMAREWAWKSSGAGGDSAEALPALSTYLDNADSVGSSFVNVSHWIFTSTPKALDHAAELMRASSQVQRVLRLVNDMATYQRDLRWGDINALLLDVDRAEVTMQLTALTDYCQDLLRQLESTCPREASYLSRQIGFSSGFYQVADFWGDL